MSDPVAPVDTAELLAASVAREEHLHAEIDTFARKWAELVEGAKAKEDNLRVQIEQVIAQRDAAEERFVKAREEASELEQEMADLRQDLLREKSLNSAANVRSAITLRPWWKRVWEHFRA